LFQFVKKRKERFFAVPVLGILAAQTETPPGVAVLTKPFIFKAMIAGASAVLAACSPTAITPQAENPEFPEVWVRGGSSGGVTVNWLEYFANPELDGLVSEAVDANYQLRQERARLLQAGQSVVIARAGRLPSLDLSVDASRRGAEDASGVSLTTESYGASVDARWNVDLWGELSKEQQAAQLAYEAQRARVTSVERDIAAATVGSVFDVLESKQLLEVARRRLDNAVESHDIVASGYRQGLNDALDLYLARNQVERQQANYAQQEQAYTESVADLQLTLARYPDGGMEIGGELPVINDPIPVGLPSELLTRRTDLQEAWLNLLAADASLAAAHKARFPSLSIVGSAGTTTAEFSDLLDTDATFWNVAGGLVQPLFAGGRLKALEEQAAARVELAEQQYLQLLYRAFADVENAISRSVSLQQRYESFLDAETNSRAALTLALEQYQRGLVSYTTVLESQRQAFDAEATVVQLRNQLLQNRIALFLALGGSFSSGS
jgi:multidrug efflux system outer membrane protein